jgi:hypothetical protein
MQPVRLSLCRERLAWGVPHRATLLTPQQDVVKHAAWEIRTCREALPVPAGRRGGKIQRASLYMYHCSGHLQAGDKKPFDPKCSIVKYKKFVSLSDLEWAEGKTLYENAFLTFLE